MPNTTYRFPTGFLWGTATSSHQVEGANTNNNWSAWEKEPGRIVNGDSALVSCDWWNGKRWQEDFDRAAQTGQNAHRLSIEWSRIQPAPDRWDEEALAVYRSMLQGLCQRGLTPCVTLHHFTDPLWFTEMGGWENEESPKYFEAFVRKTVGFLKDDANFWVTINEPNVYNAMGYIMGVFPPGKTDLGAFFNVYRNLIRGHALAYRTIHELQPDAQVGFAFNMSSFKPKRAWLLTDRILAGVMDSAMNLAVPRTIATGTLSFLGKRCQIPEARRTMDFFGLNYYTRYLVALKNPFNLNDFYSSTFPEDADLSYNAFIANEPAGIYEWLHYARSFGLPVYVTENGVESADDHIRSRYLAQHIHQVWRAANNNWGVKGYFQWSLVDNFEWERGWTQRFGLWGLNPETQERIRRKSVDFYAEVCQNNALSYETVEKYAPEALNKIFPPMDYKGFRPA